jgi:ATP-binding protein involved in chromosome partitioning
MLSGAIKQLIHSTDWGDLDILFVDMPPGTGDAYLTIASEIKPDYSILVTTSNKLAINDLLKSIEVFNKLDIEVLGYIENNISNIKFEGNFNLIDKFNLKKMATVEFSNDIYNFNPNKTHILFKDISSFIESLV